MEGPDSSLSLYVHVPFCVDKCLYCDFYSVPRHTVPPSVQEEVIRQTIAQARFFFDAMGFDLPVQTVFMGGGTPSTLSRPVLRSLLAAFDHGAVEEWTVEANPESVDAEFLDACAEAGVTRISAGIQTTSDMHLRLLRRPGTRRQIEHALWLLGRRWAADVNLDFIAGIPGQTPDEVRADLSLLDDLPASHVSLYSLTYEPETQLARLVDEGEIRRNSEEMDEELWFAGSDELARRGFRQYEISNFSRPGKECRHNIRYWRIEPYLGAGPAAVSTLPAAALARALARPDLAGLKLPLRVTNPKDIGSFLHGRDQLWGMQTELVDPEDFLLETLMMGLRLEDGIPSALLERRFGSPFERLFPGLWESWSARGLALPPGEKLSFTATGRMFLDGLLTEASRVRGVITPPASGGDMAMTHGFVLTTVFRL